MPKPMVCGTAPVAVLLILHAGAACAGGGLDGGATEITQLLNHAELASSVAQQAQMVEQNVQPQITRLQQYVTMVQNLKQVPTSLVDQTIAPYRTQITNFQSLSTAITQLQQAATATNGLFGRSLSEMNTTGMSPGQWLSAYTSLASTRGGLHLRTQCALLVASGDSRNLETARLLRER